MPSLMLLQIILVGVIGYLIGSLQFARLVALATGVDLAKTGSGVASVANVRHTLGSRWAALATLGDAGKALLSVGAAERMAGIDWASYVGVCVMIGHNWPIFADFNGGRGMLAALGTAAVLLPRELVLLALILIPLAMKIHDTAPFSLAAMVLFPIVAVLFGEPRPVVIAFVAIGYIIVVRRLTAPPRGRFSWKTLASKLIFDRPDPRRHWTLETREGEDLGR